MSQVPQITRRINGLRRRFKLADKMKKVKKTMYTPGLKKTNAKSASQTPAEMNTTLLSQLEKKAFVPGAEVGQMDPAMMQAMMAGGGGDPSMGGGMPMDPSAMGAPPMDPSMMGAPPVDPAMMGAPPMDPSMMGAPPAPAPAPAPADSAPSDGGSVTPEDFQQLQDQVDTLENTIMDLLDMVEKTKSLTPDEPGAEAEGAAPAAVQQDIAQPMGGPLAPGANDAMGALRLNNLGNPDALSGLISRLQG